MMELLLPDKIWLTGMLRSTNSIKPVLLGIASMEYGRKLLCWLGSKSVNEKEGVKRAGTCGAAKEWAVVTIQRLTKDPEYPVSATDPSAESS